nr:hypothetical protein [Tanacetum cinerariifolium]
NHETQQKPNKLYLHEQPIIKDVKEEDEHVDEDGDSDDNEDDEDGDITTDGCKQSRLQKKSHKAMLKLRIKVVLGVSRVTIKRTKNVSSCSILSRPKELQVPSGSVTLIQWVGSSVGIVGDPTCSLCVENSIVVNDSATCDTSPVGHQRAT